MTGKGVKMTPEQLEQLYDGGGGGSACADAREQKPEPEILPPEPSPVPETFREKILDACGVDPVSGLTGFGSAMLGTGPQMIEANRWVSDLGLTEDEVLAEIAAVMARKRDGPPRSLNFFTPVMQRLAADLEEARTKQIQPQPLKVIPGGRHDRSAHRARGEQAITEYHRRLRAGEIDRGPDPSDPSSWG